MARTVRDQLHAQLTLVGSSAGDEGAQARGPCRIDALHRSEPIAKRFLRAQQRRPLVAKLHLPVGENRQAATTSNWSRR